MFLSIIELCGIKVWLNAISKLGLWLIIIEHRHICLFVGSSKRGPQFLYRYGTDCCVCTRKFPTSFKIELGKWEQYNFLGHVSNYLLCLFLIFFGWKVRHARLLCARYECDTIQAYNTYVCVWDITYKSVKCLAKKKV